MRMMLVIGVALLAGAAWARPLARSSVPKGEAWWCPAARVKGDAVQCQRTVEDCRSLVRTWNANGASPDPECVRRERAFCHSFRPRVSGHEYGPPEAYCFAERGACEEARRDTRRFGDRYIEQSECAVAK